MMTPPADRAAQPAFPTTTPAVSAPNGAAAARAVGATKVYGSGETAVRALDEVTVEFPGGRFTTIMGPSGSGKSTLLHCVAGLDTLTSGRVWIGEVELGALSDKQLTVLRRERVGFVFQSYNLLPTLTALENITLPLLIFADEPTGNLDSRAGAELLDFLRRAVRELGQTIVMVTHDPVAAGYADTALFLADGRIVDWMDKPTSQRVLDRIKALGE